MNMRNDNWRNLVSDLLKFSALLVRRASVFSCVLCSVFLLLAFTPNAFACTCVKSTLQKNYAQAQSVVVADVITLLNEATDTNQMYLAIRNAWKTDLPAVLVITVSKESCSYELLNGEKHLLFLERLPSGIYTTSQCRGNLKYAKANKQLRWLNANGKKSKLI
jgi:hypothetical protein